jgi:toxin FitB
MIVLDTNVLSEVMRPAPSPRVLEWFKQQLASELFLTSITVAEIYYGIERLPRSKRRESLLTAASGLFDEDFADRILPFDTDAAAAFGRISAQRRALGRPISTFDAQIAAIAQLHGAILATHNLPDFEHCDLRLIDPWQS